MKRICYLNFMVLLFVSLSAEAQFFKKLTKKVEQKVEDAVVKNVSDKAASTADEKLNKLWETSLEGTSLPVGGKMVDPEVVPDTYSFGWEYRLKMRTAEAEQEIVYLLEENAPYVGLRLPQADQLVTVLDKENRLSVLYLSSEGKSYMTAARFSDVSSTTANDQEVMDMKFEKVGAKTIEGYHCQGYRGETEDAVVTFFLTDEVGISFQEVFKANPQSRPESFDPEWIRDGTGLLMELEMKSKEDPSENMILRCSGLEQKDFIINKSEYNR